MTLAEQVASLNLPEMTDDELAKYCGLTPAQWEKHKPHISSDDRAFYNQARAVEMLCPLWESGVEPYPSDLMVDQGRKRKAR